MKETKTKKWWRIFKVSKFNEDNLESDLQSIITKYNEKGFRDARILKDTNYLNPDNTLTIEVWLHEGNPYTFRNITFVGNTKYTNEELSKMLSIENGDVFDKSVLDSRIYGSPINIPKAIRAIESVVNLATPHSEEASAKIDNCMKLPNFDLSYNI